MVESQAVPEPIRSAIVDAYAGLGEGRPPVAVRSSATAEDTASASFAGMNETFLNERSESAVVDAVRRCWASLFGARTIFYRAKRGLDQAGMDIAVVVQRQVASTRAGVMFTVDPAAGREDRLVIEGSFGLGESVVSGSVSPDRYVVDKESLRILTREVRRKELVVEGVPEAGGTVVRGARPDEAEAPTLDDREVHELAELGRRIESHYGAPQDTEWAYDPEGRVWILQSRPVTTLASDEPAAAPGQTGRVLLRGLGAAPGGASGPRTRGRDPDRGRRPHRRRRPRRAHDDPRLGAAHAARRRDRHRLRRNDLPRGDRVARARDPLPRRHRLGDRNAARRGARDGRRRQGCRARGSASRPRRPRRRPPRRQPSSLRSRRPACS